LRWERVKTLAKTSTPDIKPRKSGKKDTSRELERILPFIQLINRLEMPSKRGKRDCSDRRKPSSKSFFRADENIKKGRYGAILEGMERG